MPPLSPLWAGAGRARYTARMSEPIRLARRVAELTGCTRAEAEAYIRNGWVSVDGAMVETPQLRITDEVVARWHGGPFATFLHALAAVGGLWRRSGVAGGVIGRLLAAGGRPVDVGDGGWQAVAELGLGPADVEQSRSILSGLAAGGTPQLRHARYTA